MSESLPAGAVAAPADAGAAAPSAAPRPRARGIRLLIFRVVMVLVALLHLLMFGAWQAILAPWVTFADEVDHGWERTPALHALSDGVAGALFLAVTAAAVVLAVRPARMSALAAWLAAALTLTGAFSWLSALLQGHDDVLSTVVFSAVWVALVAAAFVWLHPERREILRGGAPAASVPPRWLRIALAVVGAAGVVVAVGAVAWRLSGGIFESPLEDDVFSFVYAGLLCALAAFLARAGRAGWVTLSAIVLVGAAYGVAAAVTFALT